jgi:hypothetical protein
VRRRVTCRDDSRIRTESSLAGKTTFPAHGARTTPVQTTVTRVPYVR